MSLSAFGFNKDGSRVVIQVLRSVFIIIFF